MANNSPYFAPFKEDVRGQGGVGNQTLLPQLRGQVLRPEKETAGVPEMRDRSRARAAEIAVPAALSLNWRRGSPQLPALFCLRRFFNDPQDYSPRLDKIAEWRAAHRGRVVKPTGDGLLAKVASVVDAVAASVKF